MKLLLLSASDTAELLDVSQYSEQLDTIITKLDTVIQSLSDIASGIAQTNTLLDYLLVLAIFCLVGSVLLSFFGHK